MRRIAGAGILLLIASSLHAQQTERSFTRLIMGGGVPPAGARASALLGFEFGRTGSSVTWRIAAEGYGANATGAGVYAGSTYHHGFTVYGLQLLGERTFRNGHRFEPYALAGVGLYYRSGSQSTVTQIPSTGPGFPTFAYGEPQPYRSTQPALIVGAGLNVRIGGMKFFGELKPGIGGTGGSALRWPPHAPLVFGFRF